MTPLAAEIHARIAAEGPIPVATYMAYALGHPTHGYYATRDPFGAAGDFVTAPEISQMFGELVGGWIAQAWIDQGRPDPFVLAELGPGRGTLMADALRVLRAVPGFIAAARLHLVETSPTLRAAQKARLATAAPVWTARVEALPDLPSFVVANEFFDALPIRQHQRVGQAWRERRVGRDGDRLVFVWARPAADADLDRRFAHAADGAIVEDAPVAAAVARTLGARIAARGGAALVVDYGAWEGTGDTLQALRAHAPVDPLASPGEADLTAHVRFRALAEAAAPAVAQGPRAQGDFLARLGIAARAARLAEGRSPDVAAAIAAQLRRLTDPGEMGTLFQAMALAPLDAPVLPGFERDDA